MTEVTGRLTDVIFNDNKFDPRYPNIVGLIETDNKGRFYPGDRVWTSKIKEIYKDEDKFFVKTNFSLYEVEFRTDTVIPEEFKQQEQGTDNE